MYFNVFSYIGKVCHDVKLGFFQLKNTFKADWRVKACDVGLFGK